MNINFIKFIGMLCVFWSETRNFVFLRRLLYLSHVHPEILLHSATPGKEYRFFSGDTE